MRVSCRLPLPRGKQRSAVFLGGGLLILSGVAAGLKKFCNDLRQAPYVDSNGNSILAAGRYVILRETPHVRLPSVIAQLAPRTVANHPQVARSTALAPPGPGVAGAAYPLGRRRGRVDHQPADLRDVRAKPLGAGRRAVASAGSVTLSLMKRSVSTSALPWTSPIRSRQSTTRRSRPARRYSRRLSVVTATGCRVWGRAPATCSRGPPGISCWLVASWC
jgi:hypothetical protein